MSNTSCNKCGKDIPHDSTFCPLCGAYQATSADSSSQYLSPNPGQDKPAPQKAALKETILGGYVVMGVLYTLYGWLFGPHSYKGFMYNLGRSIIWPAVIFPDLGNFLTAIILVVMIAAIVLFKK